METTLTDRFAVVQDVYELEDWQTAAELLTEILELPAVTARKQARKSHGYLATNLPRESAQRLRDACAERGVGSQLVPQSGVIPVIKPVRTHHVRIAEDALWLGASSSDAKTLFAWDVLRLIAVTKTTKKESLRRWETTSIGDGESLKMTTYTEEYGEYLADIFAVPREDQVLGVRLMSRELNYSEALGNATPDALVDANARMDGFRRLLSSIAARASNAYIPPNSLAFLHNTDSRRARMPPVSLDDFDGFNRWLLQRLRLKGFQLKGPELP